MPAIEISRTPDAKGMTHVVVASGFTDQLSLVVPTDMVDQPGYQDMLERRVADHQRRIAIANQEGLS